MALIGRIILGSIFIYASIGKILKPDQFAEAIKNYRLLPVESVNFFAVILPWIELIAGLCLLIGLFSKGSSLIIALLSLLFLGAIVSALIRGLDISCGCFSSREINKINFFYFIRDLFLFLLASQVLIYDQGILSVDKLLKRNISR